MSNENQSQSPEPQNIINSSSKSGLRGREWSDDEKRRLAAVTFPLIEMQKQYGRKINPKLVMQGWQIKFACRFTVDQLLFALDVYTDKNDDFPSPNNLIAILEPEEPRVTEAQFIEAQKWQERNGFPMFSDAKDTIERYKAQDRQKRESHEFQCDKLRAIAQNSYKRLGDYQQPEKTETMNKPVEKCPALATGI